MNKTCAAWGVALVLMTSLQSTPSQALEQGDWLVRGGVAGVFPDDSSNDIGAFPGNRVEVGSSGGIGLTLTYMVTDTVAVELLGASPFTHDIDATGPDLFALGKIAEVRHLPPTLLVNYHFSPPGTPQLSPYLGLGVNHTLFFDDEASDSLEAALGQTDLELDNSTGLAMQAGADYQLDEHWMFNAAVWVIDIDTTAEIAFAGDPSNPDDDGRTSVDVEIDPWVLMVGLAYRF